MKRKFVPGMRRVALLIAGLFGFVIVAFLGVVALPCETMNVVIINATDSAALVRIDVWPEREEVWRGRLEPNAARELSLVVVGPAEHIDVFSKFPEVGDRELIAHRVFSLVSYPLSIDRFRFELTRDETLGGLVFDRDSLADRFESDSGKMLAHIFETLSAMVRCLDCEIAIRLRRRLSSL